MTTKIILEIRRGVLVGVHTDQPAEYVLVDWDIVEDNDMITDIEVMQPDHVEPNIVHAFDKFTDDDLSHKIAEHLRTIGF